MMDSRGPQANSLPTIYGSMAIVSGFLVAWLLHQRGGHLVNAATVPVMCAALAFSRWRFFASLVPASVFIGVGLVGLHRNLPAGEWDELLLGVAALTTIAAAARFQTVTDSQDLAKVITSRLHFSPPHDRGSVLQSFGIAPIFLIVPIVASWMLSSYGCKQFTLITKNPSEYAEYAAILRNQVGLIPEAYTTFRLIFALSLMLWIAREVFAYLQIRGNHGSIAAMHLRSELWSWDGTEQRRISKQLRRNEIQ